MKGKEMKLKRILACLIAAATVSVNAFAFTPYLPETETESESTETTSENQSDSAAEQEKPSDSNMVSSFKPRDYQYRMLEQILDAYVEKHLYSFTEEEVLHKVFEDFLNDNPMYFSTFIDYLLGTMDPYSSYYSASSNFLEPQSESTGFGFTIKDSKDGIYIESVLPGSNAQDAGFAAGDRFVSIAGINVEKQAFDVVTAILASPKSFMEVTASEISENATAEELAAAQEAAKNPVVEIVVDRNGEKLTKNLTKGPMYLSQIASTIDENNGKPTAFIEVSSFLGENTVTEFTELVKKYADDGIKYLTIDLRNNGGGSLDYALSMVEIFVENGELIAYYNDRTLEKPKAIYSTNDKISFDSITILINENTASAAELFTSILHDKKLAKVVGTKSYGKSLGQEVYTLANGDFITITTYQMLNESLESYDGIGIKPDIAIEDVEMCYTLPALGVFNYQNYVEIKEGVYGEVAKALEDRMVVMGILREEYCDGIFDETTKTALYVFQKEHGIPATGFLDSQTVSVITRIINAYKPHTYYDNTQYDVAMIIHHSFSQGKRLANEKERLRQDETKKIEERDAALLKASDAALAAKENNQEQ